MFSYQIIHPFRKEDPQSFVSGVLDLLNKASLEVKEKTLTDADKEKLARAEEKRKAKSLKLLKKD